MYHVHCICVYYWNIHLQVQRCGYLFHMFAVCCYDRLQLSSASSFCSMIPSALLVIWCVCNNNWGLFLGLSAKTLNMPLVNFTPIYMLIFFKQCRCLAAAAPLLLPRLSLPLHIIAVCTYLSYLCALCLCVCARTHAHALGPGQQPCHT